MIIIQNNKKIECVLADIIYTDFLKQRLIIKAVSFPDEAKNIIYGKKPYDIIYGDVIFKGISIPEFLPDHECSEAIDNDSKDEPALTIYFIRDYASEEEVK